MGQRPMEIDGRDEDGQLAREQADEDGKKKRGHKVTVAGTRSAE
jgi:hypothetical protein